MAHRQIRNIAQANLTITNKILKIDYPYVIYQVSNIATLKKFGYQEKPKPKSLNFLEKILAIFVYIISIISILFALIFYIFKQIPSAIVFSFFTLIIITLYRAIIKREEVLKIIRKAKAGVAKNTSQKEINGIWFAMIGKLIEILFKGKKDVRYVYGVSISSNDGKNVSISDYRESRVEEIMTRLSQVMENQDIPANYHFVVEGDMIQQSGNFDVGVNQGSIN
jgi:uncharacterized protein YejL (UPF0352 family)